MKKITCEMCGSNDLLKKDGVFECQNCGTKYSLEEAKKMLVDGTVKIDRKDDIEKYLEIIVSAAKAENFQEVELYANKIIEIDEKNALAWFAKGNAAGWQSNLDNNRLLESTMCWSKALHCCEKEQMNELVENLLTSLSGITMYLIELKCQNFSSNPNSANLNQLLDIKEVFDPIIEFALNNNIYLDVKILISAAVNQIVDAIVLASNNASAFFGSSKGEKTKEKYTLWLDYMDNCITALKVIVNLASSKETIENIFKILEQLQDEVINSCSYVKSDYGYDIDTTLNATAKALRKKEKDGYLKEKQILLNRIEQEEKEKKQEYWEIHPDEKEALEKEILKEKEQLEAKKRKLDKLEAEKEKIEQELKKNVPSQAELNSLQEKREKLETEKNNLGLFKSKEKKMVLEQINDIENKIDNISKKVAKEQAELKKQIEPDLFKIEDKIKELNKEIEECQKIIDSKEKELI